MAVYYNEWDKDAADWLRDLIAARLIPDGDVDERSITDVKADELRKYTQCHFFAGIGGWPLALRLAGVPESRRLWTGSCPCQPFSNAGKQQGTSDERHLLPVWLNLIRESRPPELFGEQVESAIRHGWLDLLQGELEREGYAVAAVVLGAHSVGAPHIRQRLYFVANTKLGSAERLRLDMGGKTGKVEGGAQEWERVWDDSGTSEHAEFLANPESSYGRLPIQQWQNLSESGGGSETLGVAHAENRTRMRSFRRGDTGIDSGRCRESSLLAQPDLSEQNPLRADSSEVCGLPEAECESEYGSFISRRDSQSGLVADATRPRRRSGETMGGRRSEEPRGSSEDEFLGNNNKGLQGRSDESREYTRELSPWSAGNTFWSNSRPIWCRDEKYRPVEPRVFPLAYGLPRGMGAMPKDMEELARLAELTGKSLRDAKAYRKSSLKGYGNAIVPELAAEFVRAYLDVIGE